MLACVCGYVATTGVHRLDRSRLGQAIELLSPAEAATHMPHPNLWSWRTLLADAGPASSFLAFFLADPDDPALGPEDEAFRVLLSTPPVAPTGLLCAAGDCVRAAPILVPCPCSSAAIGCPD